MNDPSHLLIGSFKLSMCWVANGFKNYRGGFVRKWIVRQWDRLVQKNEQWLKDTHSMGQIATQGYFCFAVALVVSVIAVGGGVLTVALFPYSSDPRSIVIALAIGKLLLTVIVAFHAAIWRACANILSTNVHEDEVP